MRVFTAFSVVYIFGLCLPAYAARETSQLPFTLTKTKEDGVSLVKCTAVEGNATTTLAFDGKVMWEGEEGVQCSSAYLYFDGNSPKLLLVNYQDENGKGSVVYRYKDGNSWRNHSQSSHESMLRDLKEAAKKKGTKSTSDSSTLDVTMPDEDYFDVSEKVAGELKTYTYTPKGNAAVNLVTCGTYDVARLNTGEKFKSGVLHLKNSRSPLFYLVVDKHGSNEKRYYGRENGAWTTFSKEDFDSQLAEMKQTSVGYVLDISKDPESSKVVVSRESSKNLKNKRYNPKANVRVTSLVDGHTQIWSADGNEKIVGATLSTRDDCPALFQVQIETSSGDLRKYFKGQDGAWATITKKAFNDAMEKMIEGTSGVILGLANTDKTKIKVSEKNVEGVTKKDYSAKSGQSIVSVVDGPNDIWSSDSGDLESVYEYFRSGHPRLLHLVTKASRSDGNKYFKKLGGKWESVTRDEFNKTHEAMKQGPGLHSLDISQDDHGAGVVGVSKSTMETGATQKIFEVSEEAEITAVTDGSQDLWAAEDSEKCVGVTVHSKDDLTVLSLDVKDDEGRFTTRNYEKSGDKWTEVDENEYSEKLDDLADLPESDQDGSSLRGGGYRFTINIASDMSGDRVSVVHPTSSNPYMVVNALAGTVVTRVTDGKKNVWQRRNKESCLTAAFFLKDGEPLLAKLLIRDGINISTQYFKKSDRWHPTDQRSYQKTVDELSGGEGGEYGDDEDDGEDDEDDGEDEDSFLTVSVYSIIPIVLVAFGTIF